MSLNDLLLFLFLKVCTSQYCCSITNAIFLSLYINVIKIHMTKQEKFTTRSSKLKVNKSKQYHRFPLDFLQIFSFLLQSFFFCFLSSWSRFFKLKIFIRIHIRLCGRVSDKKILTRPISGNKTIFFDIIVRLFTVN